MKRDNETSKFESALHCTGFFTLLILVILLVINVWVDAVVIDKLIQSDLIVFGSSLAMYWLMFYKKNDTEDAGE